MENINVRERLFFYIGFLVLIILMALMLKPFFTVLVVSLISVIMLKPLYEFFFGLKRVKERKGLAASLTLLAVLLVLVIPVLLIVWLTANQLSGMVEQLAALDVDAAIQRIQQTLAELPWAGEELATETTTTESAGPLLRSVAKGVADFVVSLGASIPNLIIQGLIFVIAVATLLPMYDALGPKLAELSPLGSELSELYNRKITAMVKSLVLGVFLIAILQGAVMGFFFWIAGLPYVFLLSMVSMMLALIPMVGISWLVVGIAIISALTGNWGQALIVLFGFYGIVNWIDVLLRPKLLSEEASINFGLFMLAIFGGLAWAGVMGLFYGPVLMLLLVTTIDIYAERYAHEDRGYLGDALSRLDRDRDATAPEAEAGPEGTERVDSESQEQAADS
jgi:predicted PurR-regulated permease PerM